MKGPIHVHVDSHIYNQSHGIINWWYTGGVADHLVGGLLGCLLELLQCGNPLVPVCLALSTDEDVAVDTHAGTGGLGAGKLWT